MKDRIVIWGQDEKDTDVLIAIRLLQNSDIIKIWTFPKKGIDDAFVDGLFKDWKDGAEEKFPQPYTLVERGISEENMLPEGLKTPKTDVIKIAEQEWRVRVLSYRLYEHIKQQIEQLKVRVGNLSIYSKDVWEEAKDVSRSIKENTLDRNIKREQTTELRKGIDEVFDLLKKLQNVEQAKYLETSKNNMVAIRTKVTEVLEKVGTERSTKPLWNKLLSYQQEAKGMQMSPRDRNALRLNFNEAFNALKADIQSNVGNRLNARVNGLKGAIGKMEASIKRDKDNVAYQSGRINKNNTTQLEYQLRGAKLKLIEDRIHSKEQKLHDMYLTLKELEKKSEKIPKPKKVNIKATQKVAAASAGLVAKDTKKEAAAKDETPKEQVTENDANASVGNEVIAQKATKTEAATNEASTIANETAVKTSTKTNETAVADKPITANNVVEEKASEVKEVIEKKPEEVKNEAFAEDDTKTNETPAADAAETKTEQAKEAVESKIEEAASGIMPSQEVKINETVTDAVEAKTEEAKEVVESKIEEAASGIIPSQEVKINETVTDAVEAKTEQVKEAVESKIEEAASGIIPSQEVKVNETVTDTVEAKTEQVKEAVESKIEVAGSGIMPSQEVKINETVTDAVEAKTEEAKEAVETKVDEVKEETEKNATEE